MESFVSAREAQSANVSRNGLTIDKANKTPQSEYFKQYLDSNSAINNNKNNDNDNDNSNISSNSEENALSFTDSIKYQSENNDNAEEEIEEEGNYCNLLSDDDFKFHSEKSRELFLS